LRRQSDPAVYHIHVTGPFPEAFPELFGGFTIEKLPDSSGCAVTEMTGNLADQTALLSLLKYLDDTGLVLLSVETIDPAPGVNAIRHTPSGGTQP
jgi:hypothetical protein